MWHPNSCLFSVSLFTSVRICTLNSIGDDTDPGSALLNKIEFLGRGTGNIDYPPFNKGTTIIDPKFDGFAVVNVHYPDNCSKGQRAMCGGHLRGVGAFATGRHAGQLIPGGFAALLECRKSGSCERKEKGKCAWKDLVEGHESVPVFPRTKDYMPLSEGVDFSVTFLRNCAGNMERLQVAFSAATRH